MDSNGLEREVSTKSGLSQGSSQDESKQDTTLVVPSRLEEQAEQFEASASETKAWLTSFGLLKPGTDVSLRFRLDEETYPMSAPHSLLPLLSRLLKSWFNESLSDSQGRANVAWLLKYITDYVKLGHWKLDPDEVCSTCRVLLYICNNARHHSHLEGCVFIFVSIAEEKHFPRACLAEVLNTLSSAVVILEKPLSRLDDFVRILASQDLADDTMKTLYTELASVTEAKADKQPSQNVNASRGAARHLKSLLQVHGQNEKYVVALPDLLEATKKATQAKYLRLATEILVLLTAYLDSQRIEELVDAQDYLAILLDVFEVCKESTIIPDLATENGTNSKTRIREENLKREARYKRDHDLAVANFRAALAIALPLMDPNNAHRLWQTIKYSVDSLRAEARASAIDYAIEQQICRPLSNNSWNQELSVLIDKVVVGTITQSDFDLEKELQSDEQASHNFIQEQAEWRVKQRLRILKLCVQAIGDLAERQDEHLKGLTPGQSALEAGKHALNKLLTIFITEPNSLVIRAFLDEMIKLCRSSSEDDKQPYAPIIIQYLQERILSNAPVDNTTDSTYCTGTEAIRTIFLENLGTRSNVANLAYQALLKIADYQVCRSQRCRLAAMSVLFRIRCDTAGYVYVDTTGCSAHLAGALCKTHESLSAMFSEADADKEEVSVRLQRVLKKQLWMYPQEENITKNWQFSEEIVVRIKGPDSNDSDIDLDISDWILLINQNLQEDKDWETYSYSIVHFSHQLVNTRLFEYSQEYLASLRGFLSNRVRERSKMFEPPRDIGLDKADVALCIYSVLTQLIPYAKMQPPSQESVSSRRGVDLVRAFRAGIADAYEGTARTCIHALSICCFETPEAIGTEYPAIIQAMAQKISQTHLLVHILEFLAQVARLPHLHVHFMDAEIRQIFGICINALKALRTNDEPRTSTPLDSKRASAHARSRGGLLTPYRAAMLKEKGLTQYSCALAYHTMIFWFLSIPVSRRHEKIEFILPSLVFRDAKGQENVDQQTIVLVDLMQRTAFSDLPETARDESFSGPEYEATSYIDGTSVITIETHKSTGRSQITKRQASGTTHAVFQPLVQQLTPHHDRAFRDLSERALPSHSFLNMVGSATPIPVTEQPLKLNPNEAYVTRALNVIDHMPTVDSHSIAVTLLTSGQTKESEYLSNTTSTPAFEMFLDSIGTRVSLQPPCPFTSFGLVHGIDGEETIAWRDRINEIVYEVSTLMPNVEDDEFQTRKKSHLGNCLVLIVFNQSNKAWRWDQFASQATLVNIVISPANRVAAQEKSDDFEHQFFTVEVLTKEEYQNVSAAAEMKVVSGATLAHFVRMLALNANIFSGCARNELTGDDEFPSSWRYRLKEIVQLRQRTLGRIADSEDTLLKRYDFNRWT